MLQRELGSVESPVVFCHNDLTPANIVYDEKKGGLRLLHLNILVSSQLAKICVEYKNYGSYFQYENCVPNYEFYRQVMPFIRLLVVFFTMTDLIYICNMYTKRFIAVYE